MKPCALESHVNLADVYSPVMFESIRKAAVVVGTAVVVAELEVSVVVEIQVVAVVVALVVLALLIRSSSAAKPAL